MSGPIKTVTEKNPCGPSEGSRSPFPSALALDEFKLSNWAQHLAIANRTRPWDRVAIITFWSVIAALLLARFLIIDSALVCGPLNRLCHKGCQTVYALIDTKIA